jgi:predicted KAP-like P-loop ATPase
MPSLSPHQLLVFERVYAHRRTSGEWPVRAQLQRELARDGVDANVREIVMQAAPYAGIESPDERVLLTVRGLGQLPAARPLLDAYIRALNAIVDRYTDTEAEARYGSDDVKGMNLEPDLERELSELLRRDHFAFGSGGGDEESWSFEISEHVVKARDVRTVEDLMALRFGESPPAQEEDRDAVAPDPLETEPGAMPRVDADRPISSFDEDLLDRAPLVNVLSAQATGQLGEGFVMGLAGPWGSGKTSILRLMETSIEAAATGYVVRFDPWLFSSSEELVLRFFREVSAQLGPHGSRGKAAAVIGEYAQILAPVTALVGMPWLSPSVSVLTRLWRRFTGRSGESYGSVSAEEQRKRVSEVLNGLGRRLVVVIDDLDRLDHQEIRDVVRVIKLVADFPNTTYVLAYDRSRVARALGDGDERDGEEFLEKIVQLTHEVPAVDPTRIGRVLAASISAAVGDLSAYSFDQAAYTNMFVYARSLFSTVREVRRYTNVLPGTLALIGDEVELADVLALEALHVRVPASFALIVAGKQALTQPSDYVQRTTQTEEGARQQVQAIVQAASKFGGEVEEIIKRLFPVAQRHLGGSNYGGEWLANWRRERRVAHPEVLDIYLQKTLPAGVLPATLVKQVFSGLGDRERLSTLLDGLDNEDLESLLGRLEHYEREFPKKHVEIPIAVFFNRQHQLQRQKQHVFDLGADFAVPRVVLRLLRGLDKEEVARVVSVAVSEIGTLSDRGDLVRMVGYRENSGHRLVSEAVAEQLESDFLDEVLTVDADRLAAERDLLHLLFWARAEHAADMKALITRLVDDDSFVLGLLRAALGEPVAQAMGDAAVSRSHQLDWRALTELVPEEHLAQRVKQLAGRLPSDAYDERTRIALEYAKSYADDPSFAQQDQRA